MSRLARSKPAYDAAAKGFAGRPWPTERLALTVAQLRRRLADEPPAASLIDVDREDPAFVPIKVPEFQRDPGVWDAKKNARLVSSILRGAPIPPLLLFEREEEGRTVHELGDGQQRVAAISGFVEGAFGVFDPFEAGEHLTLFFARRAPLRTTEAVLSAESRRLFLAYPLEVTLVLARSAQDERWLFNAIQNVAPQSVTDRVRFLATDPANRLWRAAADLAHHLFDRTGLALRASEPLEEPDAAARAEPREREWNPFLGFAAAAVVDVALGPAGLGALFPQHKPLSHNRLYAACESAAELHARYQHHETWTRDFAAEVLGQIEAREAGCTVGRALAIFGSLLEKGGGPGRARVDGERVGRLLAKRDLFDALGQGGLRDRVGPLVKELRAAIARTNTRNATFLDRWFDVLAATLREGLGAEAADPLVTKFRKKSAWLPESASAVKVPQKLAFMKSILKRFCAAFPECARA